MNLLARQADALFWLGRYIERTASLARILLVQTAFDRGRTETESWAWLLALYDEADDFNGRYETADARSVIRYFFNDPEHHGSILCSLEAAKANARALRAMISTDFWTQVNRAHRRIKELPEAGLRETRLAATCEAVQVDCYALFGISEATLYRDAGWRFFLLGREIERADQMSRLLDVRFAQLKTGAVAGDGPVLGDFTHWTMLLRACGGHHAYRRLVSGPLQPENVARFLIFEQSFARSLAYCIGEIERATQELRNTCNVPTPTPLLKRLSDLQDMLHLAQNDPGLIPHLHHFNDGMQRQLIALSNDLAESYFEMEPAPSRVVQDADGEDEQPDWVVEPAEDPGALSGSGPGGSATSSQSQSQSQTQQNAQSGQKNAPD